MNKTHYKNPVFRRIIVGAVALLATCGVFISLTSGVLAEGASSTEDGGVHGGGCGAWWDTCFGATWRKYELNYSYANYVSVADGGDTITIHAKSGVEGTVLKRCKSIGATHYYRLGLEVYNNHDTSNRLGRQAGVVKVKQIDSINSGGEGRFNMINFKKFSDTESWESVKTNFEKAKAAFPDELTSSWGEISTFCWNDDPEWLESGLKATFSSKSTVIVPEGQDGVSEAGTKTSDPDGNVTFEITAEPETRYVKVKFRHKITYKNDTKTTNSTGYANVETDWTVKETGSDARGVLGSGTWTVNGGSAEKTSGKLQQETVTIDLGEPVTVDADGALSSTTPTIVTVCHSIKYDPKHVEFGDGNKTTPSYSGNGGSKACVKITRGLPDATTTDEPVEDGHFWSTSSIYVPDQNDVPEYAKLTSERDQSVGYVISTDAEEIKVNFSHNMYYDGALLGVDYYKYSELAPCQFSCSGSVTRFNTFIDSASEFTVTYNGDASGTVANSTFSNKSDEDSNGNGHADGVNIMNNGNEVSTTELTITLAPGETKTICQKLTHDGKRVKIKRVASTHSNCEYTCGWPCSSTASHDATYTYREKTRSGTGYSEACITVTRPSNPSGGGPFSTGTAASTIMYAGEYANIGWDTKATSYPTRRLLQYTPITYLVPASQTYTGNDMVSGNLDKVYPNRTTSDPCHWVSSKLSTSWCSVVTSKEETSLDYGDTEAENIHHNETVDVVVPDNVGYKYCNTAGYKYQYWYATVVGDEEEWHQETREPDYWSHFDSACRTVAKKPSVAFWNGGVFTNGGIVTSLARRYTTAYTNGMLKTSDPDSLFGSWTEYIAAANGIIDDFASGAALARGSSISDIVAGGATLTISNSSDTEILGLSGLTTSTTLRSRLNYYLAKLAGPSTINYAPLSAGETRILKVSGDLSITNNIRLSTSSSYTNIYQIPQYIIFVDGNVNISGNVEQIDAWIIANGTVNTCSDFASGGTETSVGGGYSGSTVCDKQLTFNGPVFAGSVKLNRTYGADPISGGNRYIPGEIFNLNATTYLWAYAQSSRYDSSYTEAYTRELPPRY